jgi:hypothetical protein
MSLTLRRVAPVLLGASLALTTPVRGGDALDWSGFAIVRGATHAAVPFDAEPAQAQAQIGFDWSSSPSFLAHIHLVARTDDGHSERGHAGTPESYIDARLHPGSHLFRLRAGAFFLPTSRENVDALWENPYAISSSALNTWFGQELRPIGADLAWTHGGALLGATLFRGNNTFGALPVTPGWTIDDRWTVLGQKVPAGEYFASVSADTDHRFGWSGRAGWTLSRVSVLFTHIDNRSDGAQHGDLYNWKTRFDVAGFDYNDADWTVAGETGWGPTVLFYPGGSVVAELRASYLFVSRRLANGRATVRVEDFDDGKTRKQAVTVAAFRGVTRRLTLGLELGASGGQRRAQGELRYRFSRR